MASSSTPSASQSVPHASPSDLARYIAMLESGIAHLEAEIRVHRRGVALRDLSAAQAATTERALFVSRTNTARLAAEYSSLSNQLVVETRAAEALKQEAERLRQELRGRVDEVGGLRYECGMARGVLMRTLDESKALREQVEKLEVENRRLKAKEGRW